MGAEQVVQAYKGFLARRDKIVKISLLALGALSLFFAVLIGMLDEGNYWGPLLILIVYSIICLIVVSINKMQSSYRLRMAQFLLAVYCRSENNRYYLKRGVEVRPGFLGKWIEFTAFKEGIQIEEIVQLMR